MASAQGEGKFTTSVNAIDLYYSSCRRKICFISQKDLSGSILYQTQKFIGWAWLSNASSSLLCGVAESITDITFFNHVMQFLIWLNDTYEHVENKFWLWMVCRVSTRRILWSYLLENSKKFMCLSHNHLLAVVCWLDQKTWKVLVLVKVISKEI